MLFRPQHIAFVEADGIGMTSPQPRLITRLAASLLRTDMTSMFTSTGYNATNFNLDLSSWNTSRVMNMSSMFSQAGYNATTWNIGDISGWNVAKVTNHSDFINLNANQTNASVVNNQPAWNS